MSLTIYVIIIDLYYNNLLNKLILSEEKIKFIYLLRLVSKISICFC